MLPTRMFELRCVDGSIAIVSMPIRKDKPYSKARLQQAIDNHHVKVDSVREISREDLPLLPNGKIDRRFRNAWVSDGNKLFVDMPKAREIVLERVRVVRNAKLAELDIAWSRAVASNNELEAISIEGQRQALRDLPDTLAPKLEAAKDVDSLLTITLEGK